MSEEKKSSGKGLMMQINATLADMRRQRDDIQAEIYEADKAIDALQYAPISLDDWSKYLRAHIARIGQGYPLEIFTERLVSPVDVSRGKVPENERPWSDFERTGRVELSDTKLFSPEMAMPALCAIFGDQIHAHIMKTVKAKLGAVWGNDGAVPAEQRHLLLEDLKRNRHQLVKRHSEAKQQIDELLGMLEN